MNVVLLAAGEGTRLRPLTLHTPKCLVEIDGEPLLGHWLRMLSHHAQVDRILINTHYLPDAVRAYVAGSCYAQRVELVHEPTLLGTAGTCLSLRHGLGGDDILLAHADNLTLFALDEFLGCQAGRPSHCIGTMMTFITDAPETCGIVETAADGTVLAMHEKVKNPPGNRANAAVYLFDPVVFDDLAALEGVPTPDISKDLVPRLLGRLVEFHNDVYHRDIGSPESLAKARAEFPAIRDNFLRGGSQ